MRILIYIPIVHHPEEMGTLLPAIKEKYIARHGTQGWQRHLQEVEELWDRITERLRAIPLAGRKIRLYQDGLPVCDRELEIVKQVAEAGSCNHQLLLDLIREGAVLTGTEDPGLLLEEHDRIRKGAEKAEFYYDQLMEQRDQFIAARVNQTLEEGETGILFIGALHRVAEKLPQDMEVWHLFRPEKGLE